MRLPFSAAWRDAPVSKLRRVGQLMPSICIERKHALSSQKARQAVDEVAAAIVAKFAIATRWDDNVLSFSRTGVRGEIAVTPGLIAVNAELGVMLGFMKSRIEQEINSHLDKVLG